MSSRGLYRIQDYLREYLELVNELRVIRSWGGHGKGGGGNAVYGHVSVHADEWPTCSIQADPDDPNDARVTYTTVAKSALTAAERRLYDELDLCPGEFSTGEETAHVDLDDDRASLDPSGFATIFSGAGTHVERKNQLNWFAEEVPTPHEIAQLLSTVFRNLLLSRRACPDGYVLFLECVALIVAIIATGAPFELILRLLVIPCGPPPEDVDLALELRGFSVRAAWWSRAPLPDYRSEQSLRAGVDHDLTDFVLLPDLLHVGYIVQLLLRAKGLDTASGPVHVFRRSQRVYSREIRNILLEADATGRITISKLSKFLFAHLVRECDGDVADACFASSHWHNLAQVPSYYASPSHARLQSLYLETVTNIRKSVLAAIRALAKPDLVEAAVMSWRTSVKAFTAATADDKRVGNRRCPTRSFAKTAMTLLKAEIRKLSRSKFRTDQIRFHNLLTLYTIEFYSACVGVRYTPYIRLDEVDLVTGFAIVREKTTRAITILQEVLKQMRNYAKHLRSQELVQPLPRFDGMHEAPCFFISAHGIPLEVTSSTWMTFREEFFNFAPNIFRRFMRNELREANCPASVVRVWMGHASRGQHIFHPCAHYSLALHRQSLRHYLSPILADLGFEALNL